MKLEKKARQCFFVLLSRMINCLHGRYRSIRDCGCSSCLVIPGSKVASLLDPSPLILYFLQILGDFGRMFISWRFLPLYSGLRKEIIPSAGLHTESKSKTSQDSVYIASEGRPWCTNHQFCCHTLKRLIYSPSNSHSHKSHTVLIVYDEVYPHSYSSVCCCTSFC